MGNRILAQCGGTGLLLATFAFAAPAVAAAAHSASSTVPAGLRPALYSALAQDAGPAYAIGKNGCATLPEQKLTACFEKGGVQFSGKDAPALALHLAAWGRNDKLARVAPVVPQIAGNRARYAHGDVTEWWRVLPMGFEQGFTVAKRPAGAGELVLVLAAGRKAQAHGAGASWGKLSYGKLVVTDAGGHVVPARIETRGKRVLIAVNDAHAAYPLTVDPLVWIEQEVTAGDPQKYANFGWSVALDGNTALIGSPDALSNGRAYIFTKSNGVWSQSQELMGNVAWGDYGASVALNGTTAFVGAERAEIGAVEQGAVLVYTKSNGTWTLTQVLTASDGAAGHAFGGAVAISGTNAIIGAPGLYYQYKPSIIYAFSDSGGTWTQSQELNSHQPNQLGASVAVDGNTAIVGAPWAKNQNMTKAGLAVVLTQSNGVWSETATLRPSDPSQGQTFGQSVALSGNTAFIGSSNGAYVFSDSGGSWVQTQKLTTGRTVAVSGSLALLGNWSNSSSPGRVFLYADSGGTWSEVQTFTPYDPNGHDLFGFSVALDGTSALVGADRGGDQYQGAGDFLGQDDLELALSAPGSVGNGQEYTAQAIATNDASVATPAAVSVTVAVPAAATFVSATASQGSCSNAAGTVTCAFGPITANGGAATANVTFKATSTVGATIYNAAGIAKATPRVTASAPTQVVQGGCAAGYSEYDGTLSAGARAIEPDGQPYQAPAGEENGVLTAPSGFTLAVAYHGASGRWHVYPAPGGELHHQGPAGRYAWIVKAGATGGAYTFCLKHP